LKTESTKLERLKGERDLVERQAKQMKEKFTSNTAQFEEFNAYKTFFQTNPQKYGQTMGDLAQKKESYPVWADIDFLERGGVKTIEGGSKDVNNEIVQLRFEIAKLKQENKDFSAELEKA
jgi:polyisoprenoid-binding protein YceI